MTDLEQIAVAGAGDAGGGSNGDDYASAQQSAALLAIREFLKSRTSYDVLPVSFKLVMLDTTLTLKGALLTMLQNGIVSAPLWDSKHNRFAGLMTASDFVNAVWHYVQQSPEQVAEMNSIRLDQMNQIASQIHAQPIEMLSVEPTHSLYDACCSMLRTKTHRAPLVDHSPEDGRQIVLSVLTQYRVLRFVALNCKETQMLSLPLSALSLVSQNVRTATMGSRLVDVLQIFSELGVTCVPIVDEKNKLLNIYESYDILLLIKGNGYSDLNLTIGEALMRRPEDFEGVLTCAESDTLKSIMETIRRSRVLRLCVVDEEGSLKGIVTLSDILRYIVKG